jgi:hypothetical protein
MSPNLVYKVAVWESIRIQVYPGEEIIGGNGEGGVGRACRCNCNYLAIYRIREGGVIPPVWRSQLIMFVLSTSAKK